MDALHTGLVVNVTNAATRSSKFAKEQKRRMYVSWLSKGKEPCLFASIFDTIDKVWKGGL